MRAIVCGGRDFNDVPTLWRTLDEFDRLYDITLLIDGASDDVTGPYKGADYWANQWAMARNIQTVRVSADWSKFGKAAGPIRNGKMLDQGKPDCVIAFPGGRGTESMCKLAIEAGIKVHYPTKLSI